VTIVVTSTVSPDCELRGGDKKPRLADLSIKPSRIPLIDIVLFLYRAEYYGFTEDQWGDSTSGKLEVIIAKHRDVQPPDFGVECRFYLKNEEDVERQ
jgi:replicative DNA helicase